MYMTVEELFKVINSARQIKKWPGEYRIYSPGKTVFIYRDEKGLPKNYVSHTNGTAHPLTDAESHIIDYLVNSVYGMLCKEAALQMATVRTK
ncbi:MAG: hypothetical protein II208_04565 [Alphaproteobacteria bacterium]|nr:hypothetical protein [Alphaproteobacteria bacterium]